jgi:hypothetical protein
VKQGQYIFNTFWNKAVPANQRIKEIDEGLKREFIETIQDPNDAQRLIFDTIRSASEEIQFLDIIFYLVRILLTCKGIYVLGFVISIEEKCEKWDID